MDDLLSFAERKTTSLYLGTNIKAVLALEEVNDLAKQLNRARQKHRKSSQYAQIDKTEKVLEVVKSKVKAAFEAYVDHIESGNEISDVMKYNSKEVLQSVLERLNILNAAGIFHPNPPAFGNANGRCHQIKHLSNDEQSILRAVTDADFYRSIFADRLRS